MSARRLSPTPYRSRGRGFGGVSTSTPLCPLADRYTYHVLVSAAQMPQSCFGRYVRVAVIEVDHHERPAGYVPTRIAELRGVQIVQTWERCNVGSTPDCASERAEREAAIVAARCGGQRAAEAFADAGAPSSRGCFARSVLAAAELR